MKSREVILAKITPMVLFPAPGMPINMIFDLSPIMVKGFSIIPVLCSYCKKRSVAARPCLTTDGTVW